MPLITSPVDGAPMRQIIRYGIEFDVCASTGGIWLDKGELEKLIDFVKMETQHETADRLGGSDRDRDDVFDDAGRNRHAGRKRSRLADLFDF